MLNFYVFSYNFLIKLSRRLNILQKEILQLIRIRKSGKIFSFVDISLLFLFNFNSIDFYMKRHNVTRDVQKYGTKTHNQMKRRNFDIEGFVICINMFGDKFLRVLLSFVRHKPNFVQF